LNYYKVSGTHNDSIIDRLRNIITLSDKQLFYINSP